MELKWLRCVEEGKGLKLYLNHFVTNERENELHARMEIIFLCKETFFIQFVSIASCN